MLENKLRSFHHRNPSEDSLVYLRLNEEIQFLEQNLQELKDDYYKVHETPPNTNLLTPP